MVIYPTDPKNLGYFIMREMIRSNGSTALKRDIFLESMTKSLSRLIQNNPNDIDYCIGKIFDDFSKINKRELKGFRELQRYLKGMINDMDGLKVLYNISSVVGPLSNKYLKKIASTDFSKTARDGAEKILKIDGDGALQDLITNWDDLTYHYSMVSESEISSEFLQEIIFELNRSDYPLQQDIRNHLISAAAKEFERRSGQGRKPRAGDSLQQATSLIFEHIGVKLDPVPHQITGILEADHVIYSGSRSSGNMCLVSCKRTGRERVKQVSVERDELTRLRVKHIIWFFTEFDQTEQRVIDLGVRGSIFYLPDSSEDYRKLSKNPNTSRYVLPITGIRKSIRSLF